MSDQNPMEVFKNEAHEVAADHPSTAVMKTHVGVARVVDMLSGEQLPRIC